ncbi:hypothetical protein FD755_025250 [Muntiacus reevesi]|uniref:Uncharacterized protein n=1 Tax=Muntiacus reevesi TaxID=9886 RepID=A0A5N3UNZ4_MUNRE|nr:hypothetical protein FD755_025250 [Muntiacus reevesi]
MHTLLHSVPPPLQQATANLRLRWRLPNTHRQVWVSLLWDHCSLLLGPGVHKVLFVPCKSMFPHKWAFLLRRRFNRTLKRMKKHRKKPKRDTEMLETAVDEEGYGDEKDQETTGNDKDLRLKYLILDFCCPHLGVSVSEIISLLPFGWKEGGQEMC